MWSLVRLTLPYKRVTTVSKNRMVILNMRSDVKNMVT